MDCRWIMVLYQYFLNLVTILWYGRQFLTLRKCSLEYLRITRYHISNFSKGLELKMTGK